MQTTQTNEDKVAKIFMIFASGIIVFAVGGMMFIVQGANAKKPESSTTATSQEQTAAKESETSNAGDAQVLELTAKSGYSPSKLTAVAGKPVKLNVKTSNTFDCSSAIAIPKLGIRKSLPPSGVTAFSIPAQAAGTTLNGMCAMGMYQFTIDFKG